MSKIQFSKYQGAGNDFVIIENFSQQLPSFNKELVERLCDRRFGIGADGLIILVPDELLDYKMRYFNSDGQISSLCGNGARCAIAFAKYMGLAGEQVRFQAFDGPHNGQILEAGLVALQMNDIKSIEKEKDHYEIDTGSPHYVTFVEDVSDIDIVSAGKTIRYSSQYYDEGINVNFVEEFDKEIFVATYERGVENETLSCGTGVTASALAYIKEKGLVGEHQINVRTKGGSLAVRANYSDQSFNNIWLIGPAEMVFNGTIEL